VAVPDALAVLGACALAAVANPMMAAVAMMILFHEVLFLVFWFLFKKFF
ncbi:MAG: hypothetical protein JSS64_03135, partial [Bacteroidetes bacterium]|nr:hypothetical protein [Bacteroidota bacterium]